MPAEPLHLSGPPEDRLDILVVGDGYLASELGHFRAAAALVAERLLASEPMASYRGLINIWRRDVVSPESGIRDASRGVRPRSAFRARHDYLSPHAVGTLAPWRVAWHCRGAPRDVVIVLANSPRRGGWAVPFTRTAFVAFPPGGALLPARSQPLLAASPPFDVAFPGSAAEYAAETCVHEFGHACGANLADEYAVPLSAHVGENAGVFGLALRLAGWLERRLGLSFFPNVSFSARRWPEAHEGAMGLVRGAYRSAGDCKMAAERHPFCAVCRDAIIRRSIYRFARPGRLRRRGDDLVLELAPRLDDVEITWRIAGRHEPRLDGALTASTRRRVSVELVDRHPFLLGPPPRFTLKATS